MKNKISTLSVLSLSGFLALSAVALTAGSAIAATADATVTVSDACSFTTSGFTWTVAAIANQTYNTESETKSASIDCNNPDGFVVKAAGSPDTNLSGASTGVNIATGTSGSSSYWAFKVSSASSTATAPTITTGYDSYIDVPASATQIISYPGSSTTSVTGTFRTDYEIFVSSSQASDTYTGGVEYTIIPN